MKKLIMLVVASGCFGCLHTREVDTADNGKSAEGKEAPKKEEEAKAKPNPEPSAAGEPKKAGKPVTSAQARPPVEEGRPELSISPTGLLLPEGPRLIQQALTKRGYLPQDHQTGELDMETSGALRKFQSDEKLAKTGSPDRETVRRLGLSVEKVFRSVKHPGPNS